MSQESQNGTQETWRSQLRLKAGVLAGVAAIAGGEVIIPNQPAQAASKTSGIEQVGFTDNSILTENLDDAEATATRIQQMGGTAVRFVYTFNKGTAWENYKAETCNAFQAAHDHGLQPIVAFRANDGQPGWLPESRTDIKNFATTAASIIWTVASKKDNKNPGGCVQDQTKFIFEGINEPNSDDPRFNRSFGPQTPAQVIRIDYALSRTIRKEAARPEIGANVQFGQSLAASSHNPVGFLRSEGQAANTLGLRVNYDFIDIHPYPTDTTADPSVTMKALYQPAKDTINTYFPGASLTYGEIGINTTNPPSAVASEYSPPVSNTVGVSEATQVKYVNNILKTAAAEGMPFVTLFDVQDDGSGDMRASGVFYASHSIKDATPKSSQPAIRYAFGKYTGR